MLAKIASCALVGLETRLVDVEVDVHPGLVGMIDIVGLPDAAIQESRQRVRSAIINSNLSFPQKRVTVNLAPRDIEGRRRRPALAIGIRPGWQPRRLEKSLLSGTLPRRLGAHINGVISSRRRAREGSRRSRPEGTPPSGAHPRPDVIRCRAWAAHHALRPLRRPPYVPKPEDLVETEPRRH